MGFFTLKKRKEERANREKNLWIQRALAEIDMLVPKQDKPDVEKSGSEIRYSLDVRWSDFDEWKSQLVYPTFQEMLMTCIEKKVCQIKTFIKQHIWIENFFQQ